MNEIETKKVKEKLKLFDELLVSEKYMCKIIGNYILPRMYYDKQLLGMNIDPMVINSDVYNKIILENASNVKFRYKHIIFMGYAKPSKFQHSYNTITFLMLTTVEKANFNYPIYYRKMEDNSPVFINVNQLYYINLDTLGEIRYSDRESDRKIQQSNWKSLMLNSLKSRVKRKLQNSTSINIYKHL